jgi:hypothetical protein
MTQLTGTLRTREAIGRFTNGSCRAKDFPIRDHDGLPVRYTDTTDLDWHHSDAGWINGWSARKLNQLRLDNGGKLQLNAWIEREETKMTIELNGHTVPTYRLINNWSRGVYRGKGYVPDDTTEAMTPYEAAEAAGMTKIQELDERGEFVLAWDVYKWVVIGCLHGPWAVEVVIA